MFAFEPELWECTAKARVRFGKYIHVRPLCHKKRLVFRGMDYVGAPNTVAELHGSSVTHEIAARLKSGLLQSRENAFGSSICWMGRWTAAPQKEKRNKNNPSQTQTKFRSREGHKVRRTSNS